MSTMTFRAGDNATALEMVERRFGSDALILSTVYIDGRVEITATDDALPTKTGTPARPRRHIDVTLNDDVSLETHEAQPSLEAAELPMERNDPDLPSFLRSTATRPFSEVLEGVLQAGSTLPAPEPDLPIATRPTVAELRTRLLRASRIVLVGPYGAGKTQVALQLALLCLNHSPDTHVSFVFCGTGSRADGAVLAQKSHLLGMNTVFKTPFDLDTPPSDRIEIVLLSGRANTPILEAQGLFNAPDTGTLLVLPDGLRPDRIARLAAQWRDITKLVSLGHVAAEDRHEAENSLSSRDELDLLWLSDPDAIVNGLWPVEATPALTSSLPVKAETLPTANQPTPELVFHNNKMNPEAWS